MNTSSVNGRPLSRAPSAPSAPPHTAPEVEVEVAEEDSAPAAGEQELGYVVAFRAAHTGDLACILSDWLRAFRDSGWAKMCTNQVYYAGQQRLIGEIAARPNARLVVACNPDDREQIYGWACGEPAGAVGPDGATLPLIFHFVYVKQDFRSFGIAKALLRQFGWVEGDRIVATHDHPRLWANGRALAKKFEVACDPYVLLLWGLANRQQGVVR